MPRNVIGPAPFEVHTVDTDAPVTLEQVINTLGDQEGVSLCIRTATGPSKRGGYFFHFSQAGEDFYIYDFQKKVVATLNPPGLVAFINHVSGRQFDAEMLVFCQSVVNFRQDQTDPV